MSTLHLLSVSRTPGRPRRSTKKVHPRRMLLTALLAKNARVRRCVPRHGRIRSGPGATTSFAVLVNPTYPDAAAQSEAAQAAARARSLRLDVFHASTQPHFGSPTAAFAAPRS